ncbi:hypothetical protein [Lewinella sp. IMCC34183]|uniref:DUF922 domain-containing protein n=1 Tax=Lewinella sp. IMCC34183 TaxID=2248762 RepID=UPI000E253678|nr:hypothetical protein [Lewinella sp. IMCC34183]
MIYLLSLLLLASLSACSPKVVATPLAPEASSRAHLDYAPFALFERDTLDRSRVTVLGRVEIKDGSLSLNCDYATALQLAKAEALRMGGNGLIVTRHQPPNAWSTCHRITADVISLPDPGRYEDEILWHPARRLAITDFKGGTEKRPATAATFSTFRYRTEGSPVFPNRYTVVAETYFDTRSSYFKPSELDSFVLAHEQLHFDLSELYVRKFLARVDSSGANLPQFVAQADALFQEVSRELQRKQDAYDAEVYDAPDRQADWAEWVATQLRAYKAYAEKVLQVDRRP